MNRLSVADQRAEDLDLLEALVNAGHLGPVDEEPPPPADLVDAAPRFGRAGTEEPAVGLTESEASAFRDMHEQLLARADGRLSDKQRGWAERRAAELSLSYGDPARRNRGVPRGAEVETPAVLRHLPMKPPGRRTA